MPYKKRRQFSWLICFFEIQVFITWLFLKAIKINAGFVPAFIFIIQHSK